MRLKENNNFKFWICIEQNSSMVLGRPNLTFIGVMPNMIILLVRIWIFKKWKSFTKDKLQIIVFFLSSTRISKIINFSSINFEAFLIRTNLEFRTTYPQPIVKLFSSLIILNIEYGSQRSTYSLSNFQSVFFIFWNESVHEILTGLKIVIGGFQ